MNANENDHRFLLTGSPIAESPPIRIKVPARINQYFMSYILLPFYSEFLLIINVKQSPAKVFVNEVSVESNPSGS